jgi:ferredoxin
MITRTQVLRFGKEAWQRPIVCQLARSYAVTFSILKAKILPRQEGLLVMEMVGEEDEYARALAYLADVGVQVEPIDQDIVYDSALCTQCGACSGFCPSGALFIKDRRTMEVAFNPDACVDCELCLSACPPRALRLEGGLED